MKRGSLPARQASTSARCASTPGRPLTPQATRFPSSTPRCPNGSMPANAPPAPVAASARPRPRPGPEAFTGEEAAEPGGGRARAAARAHGGEGRARYPLPRQKDGARQGERRVGGRRGRGGGRLVPVGRAGEQLRRVDARHGGGKESDGR